MSLDIPALHQRLVTAFAGQLEIGELLGAGGFAAVFRAHDPVLQRDVAIKVIDATDQRAEQQELFLAEARIVATVEHPHIVPLYSAEIRDHLLCLTMRLVPGRTLADRIRSEGALPPVDAARIAQEVADALTTAHARGVVHRDIKPENILLDANGHAIVTDFGISLLTGRSSERRPGMVIGTPQYLSPEQALGEEVDGRADVYSLGVVLYEMLTGHLPFEASTTSAILAKQIIETPPPIASTRPDTPTALVTVTERALAKSPNQRPDAAELRELLGAARVPAALLAPRAVRRKKRWRRVRWSVAIVVVVVAALGMAGWSVYQTYTFLSGGSVPALSAMGGSVPEGLIAAARQDGSIHPGEQVAFAFVPSGGTWNDALLLTDSAIVRRTPAGPRRHLEWQKGSSVSLNGYRSNDVRGFLLTDNTHRAADTLYTNLSGAELGILISAFMEVARTHDTPPAGVAKP